MRMSNEVEVVSDVLERLMLVRARWRREPVRIDGHLWWILDTGGSGPATLLLPGALGSSEVFVEQYLAMGDRYRLIGVDYGTSDPGGFAAGLDRLLDRFGFRDATLVGQSLAGYLLQHFAARFPGRVHRLVLANTFVGNVELRLHPWFDPSGILDRAPGAYKQEWLARIESAPDGDLKSIQRELVAFTQPAEMLRDRFAAVATAAPAPRAAVPDGKVVVIDCADDPLLPPDTRAAVCGRYPDAQHHRLTFGGHYPQLLNPVAYNRILEGLLAG